MQNRLNPKKLYFMPDSNMCCAIPEMTARPHYTYVREEDYERVLVAAAMACDIARHGAGQEPLGENETEFQSGRKEAALKEIYTILKDLSEV